MVKTTYTGIYRGTWTQEASISQRMTQRKRYYQMKNRLLISLFAATWSLASLAPAFAGDLVVTRYFSGLWEQSHQESQGIVLQIIDQEENGMPKAVAYWFTYGDDEQSAWHMAIGAVDGNSVPMTLYTSYDVEFMQDDDDQMNPVEVSGTLVLTFHNCNKGVAEYELDGEPGSFEIRRLAGLYNGRCTGGISDNTPGDAKPLMLEVALLPPEGEDSDAKGKAKFWERADRSDFHVSAEYLPENGPYDVAFTNCDAEALYEDVLLATDGEGAVQFRSPESDGKILLTVDPRPCTIEIQRSGTVVLTSGDAMLGEKVKGPKDKDDGEKMKLELEFENLGVEGYQDAEGEVEYEVSADERELEVEIEDMPAGSYEFQAEGEAFSYTIEVNASGKGKLKFSDPVEDDHLDLGDFDPMGKTFNVVIGDVTLLTVTFPVP